MIHPKMKFTYVGFDSHKDSHTAVFLNCFYEKLGEITIGNAPSGFENFLKEAEKYRLKKTKFAFGFEDCSSFGRQFVRFLNSKNQLVKHVNPSLVASERKIRNILEKSDSIDAECAARVLLSQFDKLPDAILQDKYWVLSNLVTRRSSLVKVNTMLKNQLHSLILDNYPSYQQFFCKIDSKTALAFYEKYPSPLALKDVNDSELTSLLKTASKGMLKKARAIEILNMVQSDDLKEAEFQKTRDLVVQSAIRQLKSNLVELSLMEDEILKFLDNFDYKLTSMNGIDFITAAELISEIGDIARFKSSAHLARYAGIAPVTFSSGMTKLQYANQRGNRSLNKIFLRLAITNAVTPRGNKTILNPYLHDYYNRKISEGKTKKQALKCVERRLVNIIFKMMKHKTEYQNPPPYVPEEEKPKEAQTQAFDEETGELLS